ncbi:30S ribosomal protein S17e [Candidatus Woesearchaeota archaeon]|nr:30S ribosomal protein S17e [Candidatus Woesearchaeota archaeon]
MGRIKTTPIKRTALKLYRDNSKAFKKTFEENKPIVEKCLDTDSKKFVNIISGYVTRLAKKQPL